MRCPRAEGPEELPPRERYPPLGSRGEPSILSLRLPPSCVAAFVSGTLFAKHFLLLSCVSPDDT